MKTNRFKYTREKKQNPYIGFTSFQHFRKDELYSDLIVKPENNMTETEHVECYPIPAYVEEKGRAQGYYPDCSIAYIRVLWKEFEPKQGEYNYAFIEDILAKAKENGQTVMFRLLPHSTRESDDVPDWLKTLIECPARPLGERVKTSPSDPKFLEILGQTVKKFAERFDEDPTLAFLDITLPGSWGEGSSLDLFSKENIEKYIDIYTGSFKNTVLIGQSASAWIVHYANKTIPMGWRADGVGSPNHMNNLYPARIQDLERVWEKAPVSFEAYWWLGEWQRKGWDIDEIIQKTLSWHVSHFNAKSLPIPWEWKDKIDEWVSKMGYHFHIASFSYPERVNQDGERKAELVIRNVGVAPLYHKLPLKVRFCGENTYEYETDVDARAWLPGETNVRLFDKVPSELKKGRYSVSLSLGGGAYPQAYFATETKETDGWYELAVMDIV